MVPIVPRAATVATEWPDALSAGLIEPRRGYRFRPESAALAPLLAATPKLAERVVDLGCGSGILAVVAAAVWPRAIVVASERQAGAADRTRRNLSAHAGERGHVVEGDLRSAEHATAIREALGGAADVVVSNPPWYPDGWGRESADEGTRASTHALYGDVDDFVARGAELLGTEGEMWLVYDALRVVEALVAAGRSGLAMREMFWIEDNRPERKGQATRVWLRLGRTGAPVSRV